MTIATPVAAPPLAKELTLTVQATQSYELTLKVHQGEDEDKLLRLLESECWIHQMDGSEIEDFLAGHGIDAQSDDPDDFDDVDDYSVSLQTDVKTEELTEFYLIELCGWNEDRCNPAKSKYAILSEEGLTFTEDRHLATRFLSWERAQRMAKAARSVMSKEIYSLQAIGFQD